MRTWLLFFVLACWTGCIGTDVLEDPIVGERIETDISQVALLVGDTASVTANYYDQYGLPSDRQLSWNSDNQSIAEINDFGLVMAISPGQTRVRASLGSTMGPTILVNVVDSDTAVAQVVVSSPAGNEVAVGDTLSLEVQVLRLSGEPVSGLEVAWYVSDSAVLMILPDGKVKGLSNGVANVYAVVEGVESNMLSIQVGSAERIGTFVSSGGYQTEGTARLFFGLDGHLNLELSSDFETDFALGTFVYLSNSISGSATAVNGLEISVITTNGYKLFNVSAVDSNVGIDSYSHVIILCKPASLTFGYALMQ